MIKKQVFSFDLFDTLISRQALNPSGIFSYLEYIGTNNINPDIKINYHDRIQNFYFIRIQAEYIARKNSKNEEITLDEIYDELQSSLKLSKIEREFLLNLEINLELKFLFPISKNISLMEKIQQDHSVIISSDMYLPILFLKKIIKIFNLESYIDSIFISSEIQKLKSSGTLFHHLLSIYDPIEFKIIHIGDNYHSDYIVPKQNNLNAFFYNNRVFSNISIENMLVSETENNTRAIIEYIFGTSKLLLQNNPFYKSPQKDIYKLAVEITSPLFVPFIEWILHEAKNKTVSDICFLARDGLLLHYIASELVKKIDCNINLHYIFGSRVAWKLASIDKIDDEFINSILYEPKPKNFENMALRMGLDINFLRDFFPSHLFNKDFNDKNIQDIEKIFRSDKFNSVIIEVAKEKRAIIKDYFVDKIGNPNKIFLIDLGWSGSSLKMLSRIFELSQYNVEVMGRYFGLFKYPKKENEIFGDISSFLFSPENAESVNDLIPGLQEIMECLIPANHGLTIGYEHQNDSVYPILKTYNNIAISEFDYHVYKKGITDYIHMYCQNRFIKYDEDWIKIKPYLFVLFKSFKINPKKEYIDIFSHIYHSVDMAEYSFLPMVEKLNASDKKKYQILYNNNRSSWYQLKISHWPEATLNFE
jgi:predicted HAD superfamily hydrolase